MRAARPTGINVATTVTTTTTASADPRIQGSDGRTAYNQLEASRPAPSAIAAPIAAPAAATTSPCLASSRKMFARVAPSA
jgi:hypothetical protein